MGFEPGPSFVGPMPANHLMLRDIGIGVATVVIASFLDVVRYPGGEPPRRSVSATAG
jgi:hypothetical protein